MKIKAIVVDDDSTIRKTLEKFLTELDFDVKVAENGVEGFDLIKKERPSVVFSDMLMPGIDGIILCRQIKEDPELSSTKVILMSSLYKRSDTVRDGLECENDDFIEKPFDFIDLIKVVRSLGLKEFK